jgi:arylsulfatase A-like enzyme
MQASIPEEVDFRGESAETRALYGLDREPTAGFGRNCLLARRLVERGVWFVQLYHGGAQGQPRINWDAHEDVATNHRAQAEIMDRPVAGLLTDLKRRGLLEDTLVLWTTEFGRTPFTEGIGARGRDHHQLAFTCWMAGAGLRPGIAHGATDKVGYQVADDPVTVYDLHATVLHLLGLDHTRLTFYHNGINRRLTDVHGQVIRPLLA